jgi:hypothetical protein
MLIPVAGSQVSLCMVECELELVEGGSSLYRSLISWGSRRDEEQDTMS